MKNIKIGLLFKKRGNYVLQEKFAGKENVKDGTGEEVEHHKQALLGAGFEVEVIPWGFDFISRLEHAEVDLIFNVSSRVEASILEELGIPFVGSSTSGIALSADKSMAKRLWLTANLPTSEFRVLQNVADCQSFISNPPIPYPLFTKPVAGRGSAGITNDSIIKNGGQLLKNVRNLLETIGQPVLVERYLDGREITIGLIGNAEKVRALPPLEIVPQGSDKFLTFDKKRSYDSNFICPASISEAENEKLKSIAVQAFKTLGLRDYARIDTKLTSSGFMILESNTFAGLMCTPKEKPRSYIGFMARAEGLGSTELIQEIIEAAMERVNHQ